MLLYVHRNRRRIRDGEPRAATSTFTQLVSSVYRVFTLKCYFTSTETVGVLGTGSPGRPPRLSHSCSALCDGGIATSVYNSDWFVQPRALPLHTTPTASPCPSSPPPPLLPDPPLPLCLPNLSFLSLLEIRQPSFADILWMRRKTNVP